MTSFEKSIREDIQLLQQKIRISWDYGRQDQLLAYDAQLLGYLTALRRCLSEEVYLTIMEGLVD